MVIFQLIRKHLTILGIKCHQPNVKYVLNIHQLMFASVLGIATVSSSLNLLEQRNFEESIISVYATADTIACTANYVILVWKTSKIFEFIEDLKNIIQMSEQKCRQWAEFKQDFNDFALNLQMLPGKQYPESMAKYKKTNKLIEQLSEAIYLITVKMLLPAIMMPKFLVSFFTYYFGTDSGSDCFDLPFPTL